MSCGIYALINTETLEEYIGKSINIEVRWSEHKKGAIKGINTKLYRAIRKYGWEKFDKHIIEECLEAELNDKEIYWIKHLDTYKHGYNMTLGGEGVRFFGEENGMFGRHHTEESKQKMSRNHKGTTSWLKGKHVPEEVKRKISETLKGKPSWNKGKPWSEETKRKMSESRKGKPNNKLKGRHLSTEIKTKISETVKKTMCSEEIRNKCRQGGYNTIGRIWINNSETTKRVKDEELNNYLSNGWKLGRISKQK